ncbi:MAG: UDP:flavonoid glycosyltransferase YjiC (YdhE family), partial [Myxococcota bacterium]
MTARRFLFVVPPLTGHTNPTVSVALELERRGHTVAWVGHPGKVRPLIPEGATLFELDDSVPDGILRDRMEKARSVRGLAALKFMWEDFFLPLARAMVDGVDRAVESFAPDVMIVDQQALAGGIVARKRGLPWVTSATTSAGVTDPLEGLPKVQQWVDDQLTV